MVLAILGASTLSLFQIEPTLNIYIQTDGSSTTVEASTLWGITPPQMEDEMAKYVAQAIAEPNSTLDSIKSGLKSIAAKYNYSNVEITLESQFGEDMLPLPAVVKGNSMYPTLMDGQKITVLKTTDFKVGDIVVANHPRYGLIVKRVSVIEAEQVFLVSDNKGVEVIVTPNSTITKTPLNTWIPRQDVIGVVMNY